MSPVTVWDAGFSHPMDGSDTGGLCVCALAVPVESVAPRMKVCRDFGKWIFMIGKGVDVWCFCGRCV